MPSADTLIGDTLMKSEEVAFVHERLILSPMQSPTDLTVESFSQRYGLMPMLVARTLSDVRPEDHSQGGFPASAHRSGPAPARCTEGGCGRGRCVGEKLAGHGGAQAPNDLEQPGTARIDDTRLLQDSELLRRASKRLLSALDDERQEIQALEVTSLRRLGRSAVRRAFSERYPLSAVTLAVPPAN